MKTLKRYQSADPRAMTMDIEALDPILAGKLRAEAGGMATAYLEAVLAELPKGSITGVYVMGSSIRPWDSEIDYVPELSDVDIHVRLARASESVIESLPIALRIAEAASSAFTERFPSPAHTPRPQLFFVQRIARLEGYLPSPANSVRTLMGDDDHVGTPADYADTVASDAARFASDAAFVLRELAGKVIDRPGPRLWRVVANLTFRVGPAGPRLLTQLGMSPYDAWSLNRTAVVNELIARGHESLAHHYADFYRAGWDGFRSGFTADHAARRALSAAHALYTEGLTVPT